jgi:hypothetical protein
MLRTRIPLFALLTIGFALTGCQEVQPLHPSVKKAGPVPAHVQPAPAVTHVTFATPTVEDNELFQQSLATAKVPAKLQALLKKGQPTPNLRKFPYPYHAMLAISSDIDDTTPEEFMEYHQFLNTKEMTSHGQGLGLDVGDSFWMYMGNNQPNKADKSGHKLDGVMTYFTGTNPHQQHDADLITYFWKFGWIDSMHTFGDFSRKSHSDVSFQRDLAKAAWDAMKQAGINCEVWINHGNEANVDAFGAYDPKRFSSYQAGDNQASPYYHTDLTIKNGVHYVWDSIGETTFGQDNPLFEIDLRDHQKVWGFHRYTHEYGKNGAYDWTWVPREIQRGITKERLDQLVSKGQYAVVAQHLGGYNIGFPFDNKGIATLRMLANYQDQGKVLVARTSRLLKYANAEQHVQVAMAEQDHETWLNITAIQDPLFGSLPLSIDAVRGLTFYVPHPEKTHVLLNMQPLAAQDLQINPPDESGHGSVTIKWFTPDYTDYTEQAGAAIK